MPLLRPILDLDSNDGLDITLSEQLGKLEHELDADGIQLRLAHLHARAQRMATETGLLARIGPEHVLANIDEAVAWASGRPGRQRTAPDDRPSPVTSEDKPS
jgi:MFS superfamily sulfate permease-like transporter